MWKFKSLKGKDKWLFLLTVGVILCILAFPTEQVFSKKGKAEKTEAEAESKMLTLGIDEAAPAWSGVKTTDSYEAELEHRVKEILKNVAGVGQVDVMIVLKSSSETVIHVDRNVNRSVTEETDSNGGNRKIQSEEQSDSTVLTSDGGDSRPIVEKEVKPELSGIIISAAGGGSPVVCQEISAAMEALFDLPPHKIKVLKRVE